MDERLEIRHQVLVEGVSKREILRQKKMHWRTLEKILRDSVSPGYQRTALIAKPKIGPYLEKIPAILTADKQLPRKQRHTAKKIWQELQKAGFTSQYSHHPVAVKGYGDRAVISCRRQVIAQHVRCWDHQRQIEPTHYLGLLERKPGSLDWALPLPRLAAAPDPEGKRYVQVILPPPDPGPTKPAAGGTPVPPAIVYAKSRPKTSLV